MTTIPRVTEAAHPTPARPSRSFAKQNSFISEVLLQIEFLTRYARYLSHDRVTADDLVLEVLLKALKHQDQFTPGTNLKAWLRVIMRNTFLLGARLAAREESHEPEWMEGRLVSASDPTAAMELDDVRRALAMMPARLREPVVLASGGCSYDEIAFIVGVPLGTVRSRLSRGRERLQVLLEGRLSSDVPSSPEPRAALEAEYASLMAAGFT